MSDEQEIEVVRGGDNVFEDLGFGTEEAQNRTNRRRVSLARRRRGLPRWCTGRSPTSMSTS